MEESVFLNPSIIEFIKKNYLLTVLYIDDRTILEEGLQTKYSDKYKTKIKTVGQLNQAIQQQVFQSNFAPFFVITPLNGDDIHRKQGYTTDDRIFMDFLEGK